MEPLEVALAARQRRFYALAGPRAFDGTVPFRLSTSRAMARLVALAARRFAIGLGVPRVCVVDVGAGSGRLGFELLALGDAALRMVLTDSSAPMVAAWRAHPQLAAALADGRLSVGEAGATGLADALRVADDEALVLVGTYLLDTLPHALLEAPSARAVVDAAGTMHFEEAELDAFSRATLARLRRGRAFVPVGAFAFIRAVEARLARPALLLLADKGAQTLDEAREGSQLRLASHGAGASVAVNFDALRAWLGWRGWVTAPGSDTDLVIGATVLGGRAPLAGLFDGAAHPLAAQRAVTALRAAPPHDARPGPAPRRAREPSAHASMHAAARAAPSEAPAADVEAWWRAVLALDAHGDAVLELADALCAAPPPGEELRAAAGDWLLTAVRTAFALPKDDVAFQAGRALFHLGFTGAAAACFSHSLEHHGESPAARFNRALCLAALGATEAAREDAELVLRAAPEHAGARRLLAELLG